MRDTQNIYFIILFVCIVLSSIFIGDNKMISTGQGVGILIGSVVGLLFSIIYAMTYNNLMIRIDKKPDNVITITPAPN